MELVITRLELDRHNAADALQGVENKIVTLNNALLAATDLRDATKAELEGLDAALTLLKNDLARQALRA